MANRTFHAKRTRLAMLVIAFTTLVGGCNTVKGLGKDIEKAGEKTQEAAQKVSNKI